MKKPGERQGTHFPPNTIQSGRFLGHSDLEKQEESKFTKLWNQNKLNKLPLEVTQEKTLLEAPIQKERQEHLEQLFNLLGLSKDQEQGVTVALRKKPKVTMDKFYKTLSDANILQMKELPEAINHLPGAIEKTTKSGNFHPAALLILNLANKLLTGSTQA